MAVKNENGATARFFNQWAQKHELEYDADNRVVRSHGQTISITSVINQLKVESDNVADVSLARIPPTVAVWFEIEKAKAFQALKNNLNQVGYTPTFLLSLKHWVAALASDGIEESTQILAHWMWGVKRRILFPHLPVGNIIMPVFVGPSQAGKTTAVERLFSPLRGVKASFDVDQITDSRNFKALEENYIVFCDEMVGFSRACAGEFKRILTERSLDYRVLGTNITDRAIMNASFIGTSNHPLSTILHDTTSAMRFWEVRCRQDIDHREVNETDYELLWQELDASEDSPLDSKMLTRIRGLQDGKLRPRGAIESWLEDIELQPGYEFRTYQDLWKLFRQWCEDTGEYYKPTMRRFCAELRQFQFTPMKRENGAKGIGVKLLK